MSEPSKKNVPQLDATSSKKNSEVSKILESRAISMGKGESHSFDLRLMGADLFSEDDASKEVIENSHLSLDPRRYTPKSGFHLGKTLPFLSCRDTIIHKPSKYLMVSLPGFGTLAGGRHSCATLRNLGQLVEAHLEDPSNHLILDGALGNPAWKHESLKNLLKHERLTDKAQYFWCAAGVRENDQPSRRKSLALSTFPLHHVAKWNRCCGETLEAHCSCRSSWWNRQKARDRRFPVEVLQGFLQDIQQSSNGSDSMELGAIGKAANDDERVNTVVDEDQSQPLKTDIGASEENQPMY